MNLQQLRFLVCFADSGTLTRVAEAMHVTQPVVSRALRDLSDEVGRELLRKAGRGLVLTDDGVAAVAAMRRTLAAFDDIKPAINRRHLQPPVRIAVAQTLLTTVIAPLSAVMRDDPGLRVSAVNTSSGVALADALLSGDVDLGVGHIGELHPAMDMIYYREVELALVSPPGLDLPDVVQVEMLRGLPLICTPPSPEREMIFDRIFAAAGLTPNVVLETDDVSNFIPALQAGIGSALGWVTYSEGITGVQMRRFHPPQTSPIGFIFLRDPPPRIARFIQRLTTLG